MSYFELVWANGFISDGVIYEGTASSLSRYTPQLTLMSANSLVKNEYSGTERSNLRIWFYDEHGTNLNQVIVVPTHGSYVFPSNAYCRFNLDIDTADAVEGFNPNQYVEVDYNDAHFTPDVPDADINPDRPAYVPTGSFKFWCQKVLPTVYDDSLSYYEVLTKLVRYLNDVIKNVDGLNESIDNTVEAFGDLVTFVNTTKNSLIATYNELQDYVNTYFDNLDVQSEINAKLDTMASNGTLSALLAPYIPNIVSAWLAEHITPTSPAIDSSLTVSGAGADAKVTGDKIKDLNYAVDRVSPYITDIRADVAKSYALWAYGFISDGVIYEGTGASTSRYTPHLIYIKAGTTITNRYAGTQRSTLRMWRYSETGSNLNTNTAINSGSSYTVPVDCWVRFNLDIDDNDAYYMFDPNKYVDIITEPYGSVFGISQIPYLTGGFINKYGELITEYPGNLYTDYVSCESGDAFVFKCYCTNADIPLMTLYNTNKTFVKVLMPSSGAYDWRTVVVQQKGFVRFSSIELNHPLLAYKVKNSRHTNIGKNMPNIDLLPVKEINGFYNPTGAIEAADTWHSKIVEVDCNAGDVFHYYGNNGYNAVGCLFYNDDTLIGSYRQSTSSMGYITRDFVIDEACNKVVFCSTNTTANPVEISVTSKKTKEVNKLAGKKWCAIGDSITKGDGNNGRSYVDIISEETGIMGVKRATGGSGYYNGAGSNRQFYNALSGDSMQYDLYTIMGSINDTNVTLGTVTDTGTTTLGGCMNATINAIYTQNPNAMIAIMSPSTAGGRFAQEGYWKNYIDFQKEFCRYNAIPYLDLNACDNLRPWDDTFNDAYFYHNPITADPNHGDRTHPNEAGYKRFTPQITEFIKSVIQ